MSFFTTRGLSEWDKTEDKLRGIMGGAVFIEKQSWLQLKNPSAWVSYFHGQGNALQFMFIVIMFNLILWLPSSLAESEVIVTGIQMKRSLAFNKMTYFSVFEQYWNIGDDVKCIELDILCRNFKTIF